MEFLGMTSRRNVEGIKTASSANTVKNTVFYNQGYS